jgi:hypothetical protein
MNVFVSVGSTSSPGQEEFVRAVEDRLRAEGLVPQTVGRNVFSADSPFNAVTKLMASCSGVVVIALERLYIETGSEKRGGSAQAPLGHIKVATPWNQIEATMGYVRKLPLLVLVEEGVRADGLLEKGLDWYVQTVTLDSASLSTPTFNGVLASWRQKMAATPAASAKPAEPAALPQDMTVAQLLGALKPAQLWSTLGALAAALAGAFALGGKLFP